eukprot:7293163-Pyramimonas_sp.AAC.1
MRADEACPREGRKGLLDSDPLFNTDITRGTLSATKNNVVRLLGNMRTAGLQPSVLYNQQLSLALLTALHI